MTYQEKRSLTFILTTTAVFSGYAAFIYILIPSGISPRLNDFACWGKTYLGLVPVVAVANIIATFTLRWISKAIAPEALPAITDERDRYIELRAIWLSHCVFVAGFLAAMATQALGAAPYVMFVTLGAAGFLSALTTEAAKLYLYRTGA